MQLRPRDGTGRAITANDGKLRSFTKIMDQDESDELTYEGVRGGKIYKILQGGAKGSLGGNYVKFAEYKNDNDVNKKVPKLKNNYLIVKKMVNAAAGTSVTTKDFKTVQALQKYYVGNGLLKESEFAKILKEEGLVEKIEPNENTTDHNDVKEFVDDAIATYRKMHPNRPISLTDADYIKYVNKILKRVRKTYMKDPNEFNVVTFDATSGYNEQVSIIGILKGTKPKGSTGVDAQADNAAELATTELLEIATALAPGTTLTILSPGWQKTTDATNLIDLIKSMYEALVRRTDKLVKKDPSVQFKFQDGGRKHRSGGARKPAHHSRHRDGNHRSGHKKRAVRSHRK